MGQWLLKLAVFTTVTMVITAQSLLSKPGMYEGSCVTGGVIQPPDIASVVSCQSACQRLEGCLGLDFYSNTNRCYFHSQDTACNELVETEFCIHYRFTGCPSCIKTYYGNAKGATCVFPFIYQNEVYTNCTDHNHEWAWCATTYSYDRHRMYGNCLFNESGCTETTTESMSTSEQTISTSVSSSASTTTTASTTSTTATTTVTETTTTPEPITSTTVVPTTTATTFSPVTAVTDALGCRTSLVRYPNQFAFHGHPQDAYSSSEDRCASTCLELSQCVGLNYNFVFEKCFFFFSQNVENYLPAVDSNHYIKQRDCPQETLDPGSCEDTFDMMEDMHGTDGDTVNTATDVAACTLACLDDEECIAFDFDFVIDTCYIYTSEVDELFNLNDITHFVRVRCETTNTVASTATTTSTESSTTTLSSTTSTTETPALDPGSCEDTFDMMEDMHGTDGDTVNTATDVAACTLACLDDEECIAFDFDFVIDTCYIYTSEVDELFNLNDITHFVRVRCETTNTVASTATTTSTESSTTTLSSTTSTTETPASTSEELSSTTPGCVDTFESFEDFRAEGGSPASGDVMTSEECQELCLDNRYCAAFDYGPLPNDDRCITHSLLTRDRIVNAPGVVHYRRVECVEATSTTTLSPTLTTTDDCIDTFRREAGRFQFGGEEVLERRSQEGCENHCRQMADCVGFNYIRVPVPVVCYVFFNPADNEDLFTTSNNVDHFSRICIDATTTSEPSETTTATGGLCVDRYEISEDVFSPGGMLIEGVSGPGQCKEMCSMNDTCLGFDYFMAAVSGDVCYIHTSEDDFNMKIERPSLVPVSQYTRIRCETLTTTTEMEPTTTMPPPRPSCPVGPPIPDVACGLVDDPERCPAGFYCFTHPDEIFAVCCKEFLEGECEVSGSLLMSSSSNLYGDDVVPGDYMLTTDAQKTFINTDNPLPMGTLNEYYLYISGNTDLEDTPPMVTLCLEVWRPVTEVPLGYTLHYRKEVLVNYSSVEGALCKFDVRQDDVEIEEGDLIGWTNKLDFLPLNLAVSFGRNLHFRDLERLDNNTLSLPRPNQGIYMFDAIPLAVVASLAVSLAEPPPPGCDANPCMNGGTCTSDNEEDVFECECPDGYSGSRCEIELDICVTDPCMHGATCTTPPGQPDSFLCMCAEGFSGERCELGMQSTVSPICPSTWRVILNRMFPNSAGFDDTETEAACRRLCVEFTICMAIEYNEDREVRCRLHFSDNDLLEENAVDMPGNRHVRLIERCVTTTSAEPDTTTAATTTPATTPEPTTTTQTMTTTTTMTITTTEEETTTPSTTTTSPTTTTMVATTTSEAPTTTTTTAAADTTTTVTEDFSTTSPECTAEYHGYPNQYAINGLPFENVTNLADCQRDCQVQPTCTGLNYVTSGGVKCWQIRRANTLILPVPESTFYNLTSGCFEVVSTTTVSPTVSETFCEDNFTIYEDFFVPLGQPYQEITSLVGCINKCIELESCVGFNFDWRPMIPVRCVIHTDVANLDQRLPFLDTDNYVIDRCNEQCSADLVFVVDSSGSISDDDITNWQKVRDFLSNVVHVLPRDQVSLRVAAITFSNWGNIKFDFDDFLEFADIQEKLRNLPYGGGRTNTTGALRVMRTELFRVERGDRSRVKNVVVVLTDGSATIEAAGLAAEAQLVRYTGAEIFAIGITSKVDLTQMVQLVTEPFYSHYFRVEEFAQLMQALQFVIGGTCLGLTAAPEMVTVPASFEPITDGCYPDIALLVDASGSIRDQGRENWGVMKTFLKSVVNLLSVSEAGTHVGAVSFSNTAKLEFRFSSNKKVILDGIDSLMFSGGFTNTTGAFRLARTVLFTGQYGARPQAQDIYILITDGYTNREASRLIEETSVIKATGARIIVIGVTNATNEDELLKIVSQEQYYHRVENFDGLMATLNSVILNTGACAPVTQNPVQVCIADLALLVDSSGSIIQQGAGNYDLIKDFLKSVVDGLNIGTSDVHVGAISFSNTAYFEFGFRDNKQDIFSGIDRLRFEDGYTNTTGALRLARQQLFTSEWGDRSSVGDIILIITDGGTNKEADSLFAEVEAIKDSGKIIMAIGVTDDIDEPQLLSVVSDQSYYHRVEDFDRLMDTLDNLLTSSGCR